MLIEWDGTLELGVKEIDEHHRKLIEILNQCYQALMLNDHTRQLKSVVQELHDYTQYHFGTEERIMSELGYPAAAAHLEAHRQFVASIAEFDQRASAGESFVAIEVLTFLKEWLVAHILSTDRALADCIKPR
uniref:Hemerythrin-like metal-binding protein n=1 Tax=Geobacter sp. (strain M21) TaxID=443144 RepID=C6E8I3_GEOSM